MYSVQCNSMAMYAFDHSSPIILFNQVSDCSHPNVTDCVFRTWESRFFVTILKPLTNVQCYYCILSHSFNEVNHCCQLVVNMTERFRLHQMIIDKRCIDNYYYYYENFYSAECRNFLNAVHN